MKFDINEIWRKKHYRVETTSFKEIIDWLDENVGWNMSDNMNVLPIWGQGWRIEGGVTKLDDSDYPRYVISLEIDDDTLAVQYKLAFA